MHTQLLDPMDDAQMTRFHKIMYRAEREDGRPWTPMWSYEEMAGHFREPSIETRNVGVAAWDDDEMVGIGFLNMSLLDNLDTAFCFVAVEPELRGRGIGSATVERLLDVARNEGRTQLVSGAGIPFEQRDDSPVLSFAKRQGFTVANVEIQRDLALPVDPALLHEIAAEAAPRHAGYEIRTFTGPIPEELIASYCEHLNTFALEAPSGEVEVEAGATTPESVRERELLQQKIGRTIHLTVAVQKGRVVAHTDLAVSRAGDEGIQWGTLVAAGHRGHRLGAAVKVANLRSVTAHHPELRRITTTNAEVNAWMVAINDRLGFTPVAVEPVFRRVLES